MDDINVLVGANNSGKSSVLQGIQFTIIAEVVRRNLGGTTVAQDSLLYLRIREDTEIKNFPLYCPKCKQENLINVKNLNISVITESDALTQSR